MRSSPAFSKDVFPKYIFMRNTVYRKLCSRRPAAKPFYVFYQRLIKHLFGEPPNGDSVNIAAGRRYLPRDNQDESPATGLSASVVGPYSTLCRRQRLRCPRCLTCEGNRGFSDGRRRDRCDGPHWRAYGRAPDLIEGHHRRLRPRASTVIINSPQFGLLAGICNTVPPSRAEIGRFHYQD